MENRNIYKGHRYVPKIEGEWDIEKSYEGLVIVTNNGLSLTSKKYVPAGISITNEDYWTVTGNYNEQVENYRREVRDMNELLNEKVDYEYVDTSINNVNEGLKKTKDDLDSRAVNVINPPPPLVAVLADGTDQTTAIQNILNASKNHDTVFIPKNVIYDLKSLFIPDNVSLEYFDISKGTYEKVNFINHIHPNGIPVNEYEFSSAYHTGLVLNTRTDLNVDTPQTDTTGARSLVYRLNGKSQLINTVYENGRYRVRHVNTENAESSFGQTVYEINKDTSDLIFSKPLRMSTVENGVPENRFAVSRMIAGYSDYRSRNYYIDYVYGNDENADGSKENPFKTFERMAYESLPYMAYGSIIVVFLTDYPEDIELRGFIGLNENNMVFRTETAGVDKVIINGTSKFGGLFNVSFHDIHFKDNVEVRNCNNIIFNRCENEGSLGFLYSNSTGSVLNSSFNSDYGIRAVSNSHVISSNNSGNGIVRSLSATNGATIKKLGSQPQGFEYSDSDSLIIPYESKTFETSDGKTVTVKNGVIMSVE